VSHAIPLCASIALMFFAALVVLSSHFGTKKEIFDHIILFLLYLAVSLSACA
jgi:hypothetical protein